MNHLEGQNGSFRRTRLGRSEEERGDLLEGKQPRQAARGLLPEGERLATDDFYFQREMMRPIESGDRTLKAR